MFKRCSKINRINNEDIREGINVFNLNKKLKGYKQRWKEHLERNVRFQTSLEIQTYRAQVCG